MSIFSVKNWLVFVVCCFCMLAQSAQAQKAPDNLYYVLREAAKSKSKTAKPPVLIFLHGYGSNEEDLFSFASQIPKNWLVLALRAPIGLGEDTYAWYKLDFSNGKKVADTEQAEKSRLQLINFLENLPKKHTYNPKEVYLCGFSQGGIMSYSVALTRPDLVKGAAIMSGRLLDEVKPLVKTSPELKKVRFFISHGDADKMIEAQAAKDAEAFLKKYDLVPTLKMYKAGHEINPTMFKDLLNFLNGKPL